MFVPPGLLVMLLSGVGRGGMVDQVHRHLQLLLGSLLLIKEYFGLSDSSVVVQ